MLSATDFVSRYSEADVIVSLAISPFEADLLFLQRMFDDANWKLFTAHTCKEGMAQLDHEQMVGSFLHRVAGRWTSAPPVCVAGGGGGGGKLAKY